MTRKKKSKRGRIISFKLTREALVDGEKTVTRRGWSGSYAEKFQAGEQCQAYNRNPRNGGRLIALIRLTQKPKLERMTTIPDTDFKAEGFAYYEGRPELWRFRDPPHEHFRKMQQTPEWAWVVRFELVEVCSGVEHW